MRELEGREWDGNRGDQIGKKGGKEKKEKNRKEKKRKGIGKEEERKGKQGLAGKGRRRKGEGNGRERKGGQGRKGKGKEGRGGQKGKQSKAKEMHVGLHPDRSLLKLLDAHLDTSFQCYKTTLQIRHTRTGGTDRR